MNSSTRSSRNEVDMEQQGEKHQGEEQKGEEQEDKK